MMISPESYYEEHLKGKTKEQIMTAIRGLKQEIGRLKKIMEGPEYGILEIVHPNEDTRLYWTREYLERAKQAYAEASGTYTLSKSQKRLLILMRIQMQSVEFLLVLGATLVVTAIIL